MHFKTFLCCSASVDTVCAVSTQSDPAVSQISKFSRLKLWEVLHRSTEAWHEKYKASGSALVLYLHAYTHTAQTVWMWFFFICRYFHAEDNIASTKSCDHCGSTHSTEQLLIQSKVGAVTVRVQKAYFLYSQCEKTAKLELSQWKHKMCIWRLKREKKWQWKKHRGEVKSWLSFLAESYKSFLWKMLLNIRSKFRMAEHSLGWTDPLKWGGCPRLTGCLAATNRNTNQHWFLGNNTCLYI